MLRFSANLSTMFADLPFSERFAAARSCGFDSVEIQYPYDSPAGEIARILEVERLSLVLINAPPGSEAGDKGLAALPTRREEFRESVLRSVDYARTLGCSRVHVLSGTPSVETSRDRSLQTAVENLAWATQQAERANLGIVIEALNPIDAPGYFLRSLADAVELINLVGSGRLGLLFDVYHCAQSGMIPSGPSKTVFRSSPTYRSLMFPAGTNQERGRWTGRPSSLRSTGLATPA